MDWKKVAEVGATGAVSTIPALAPVAPILLPIIQAVFRSTGNDKDMMAEWLSDVEELEKSKHRRVRQFSNRSRALVMKGRIQYDLWKKRDTPPAPQEVTFLLEALIRIYWGVEGGVDALDATGGVV